MNNKLQSHLQDIEMNWHLSEGPCKTCPHWSTGGFSAPFYAASRENNLDADVVFVGKEPGTGSEKNHPVWYDDEMSLAEARKEVSAQHWEPSEFPKDNSAMFDDKDNDRLLEVAVGKRIPLEGRGESPAFQYYITNAKKCHQEYEIDQPLLSEDSSYSNALEHCSPYLLEEIDLIEPDVVVTLGSPATQAVFSQFDSLPPKSNAPKVGESFFDRYETPDWTLIPAIHPSPRNSQFNQFQKSGLIEPVLKSYAEQGTIDDLGDFKGDVSREAYFALLRQRIEQIL